MSNRITSFNGLISQKLYYRILLKYFVDAKVTAIPRRPDAQILYHDTLCISYQQITLDENFQVYFNAALCSKMALRTGVQFSPYQQSFEVNVGTQTVNVNFQGANRQFAWIEISLAYD